ncbi:class I SAM-dependent methyltransferase [Kitasatospora sp. NPDC091257]|uniref:class I SAM-dependent methyltransferase n=1 Tax=Kitasatospora sp. NPDC091257 TaxID=3364084 RepID=UPI00380C7848
MTPAPHAVPDRVAHETQLAGRFDAFHAARSRSSITARLYAQALGEDYPEQVGASGSCDWALLGLLVTRLRLRPRQVLVEAGCGTGGIGLWLARALDTDLVGLDLSPVAVHEATARIPHFGLAQPRVSFRVASLEDTGLPDQRAHGVVCVDALGFAADRQAALRELARVLVPGGRMALTRATCRTADPAWAEEAQAAGLVLEHLDERPGEPAMWDRLYGLWNVHRAQLERELGREQAAGMLAEAHRRRPTMPGRRAVLLTLHRPPDTPGPPRVPVTIREGLEIPERNRT